MKTLSGEHCSATDSACSVAPACACAPQAGPATPAACKAAAGVSGAALAACIACCTLPFALPAATLAVAAPLLLWLEESQAWTTPSAVAMVLAAWLWTGWKSARSGMPPARATFVVLGLATALLLPLLAWPWIEPYWVYVLRRA